MGLADREYMKRGFRGRRAPVARPSWLKKLLFRFYLLRKVLFRRRD
jgi:hypothetical protein